MNGRVTRNIHSLLKGRQKKWYFDWLKDRINECPDSLYTVSISAKVQQSPLKYAKAVNPIAVPNAVHICDYESNDEVHVQKFQGILDQLQKSNKLVGRSFRYHFGYSNFTFELWIVLHKSDCNGPPVDRKHYLKPINRAFNEQFENLDEYKHEANFKRCLSKLTLSDVKTAISRSEQIMNTNRDNGIPEQNY